MDKWFRVEDGSWFNLDKITNISIELMVDGCWVIYCHFDRHDRGWKLFWKEFDTQEQAQKYLDEFFCAMKNKI